MVSNEFTVLSADEIVAENLHIGVEMGGTSCKIGIFSNSGGSKIELTKVADKQFVTSQTNAMDTFTEMKEWTLK